MVYMTVGVGDPPQAARAQDSSDLSGKVLRLSDDGTVPADNPFVGRAGYRPEIYTMGHRNPLGLAVEPDNGASGNARTAPTAAMRSTSCNRARTTAGRSQFRPVLSGSARERQPWKEGMEQPIVFWVPAIAISGMTFYTGDKFPNWKNNLFVGGMRQGEVPRSGHLERIDFNDKWEELHRESMLRELQNRIRDVRQGPDGLLYVLTAENDGALMRIEPAPAAPAK